jgi:hypothetical protein
VTKNVRDEYFNLQRFVNLWNLCNFASIEQSITDCSERIETLFISQLMKIRTLFFSLVVLTSLSAFGRKTKDVFPDGTPIPAWFSDTVQVDVSTLGRQYILTDYGVIQDSTLVQTEAIQRVIDKAAAEGGGVIVIPRGTFLSGSLFFRQGTHLHLDDGATLKGVDDIAHYAIRTTRLEGQTLKYFSALVNADSLKGFTITGRGTINGNGLRFWREFWIRRQINPDCTNLEAMRPRLVYLSNCTDVSVSDVHLINSPFWTTHLYRCTRAKLLHLYIYAPTTGVKAPSSDAVDIDACTDVLVHGCYMSVNDDAVALKGGKGTWADKAPENGPNINIIVENCSYGTVHSALTLGSESIHDHNIILRRCRLHNANRVLWLKMRPDTPQRYEYVRVEQITGDANNLLFVHPWTQFFKPGNRTDMPRSVCQNIAFRDINLNCKVFFNVEASDKYSLSDFSFSDMNIHADDARFNPTFIDGVQVNNLRLNGTLVK